MAREARSAGDVNEPEIPTVPQVDAPKDWAALGERFLYRAGPPDGKGGIEQKPGFMVNRAGEQVPHCGATPIKGHLVDRYDYESKAIGRDFSMLAVRLTAPCVGIEDNKLVAVPAGKVMIVTETSDLNIFAAAAKHPTHTVEVWLKPKGVKAIPGTAGHTMRLWDRRIDPMPQERAKLKLPTLAFFDGPDPFPQIEGHNGAPRLPQGTAEIP